MKRAQTTLRQLGEFGWIRRLRLGTAGSPSVRVGIGDDAAVLDRPRGRLLLTADMLIEGRHFVRALTDPYRIGWKAMAVNLSDIAAMGGKPLHAVVSVGIPPSTPLSYARRLQRGLESAAVRHGARIVGGDTNASDRLVLSVALTGLAPRGGAVLRSGARPGDVLFVTGDLGGSLVSGKHLDFVPRLAESAYLMKHFRPTSMIDLSDGLASDLRRLTQASGVGAVLVEEDLPLSRQARGTASALGDGEDFELLFSLPPAPAARLTAQPRRRGLSAFTPVGRIVEAGRGLSILDARGRRRALPRTGFDHFR